MNQAAINIENPREQSLRRNEVFARIIYSLPMQKTFGKIYLNGQQLIF